MNLRYRSPAFLEDELIVETRVARMGPSSILFDQRVFREGEPGVLVEGTVRVASVDREMKPRRLPRKIKQLFIQD